MATFTPLEGDPVALDGEVGDLEASVTAIDEAVALLYSTESSLTGQAAAELYTRSLETGIAHDEANAVLDSGAAAVTEQQDASTAA